MTDPAHLASPRPGEGRPWRRSLPGPARRRLDQVRIRVTVTAVAAALVAGVLGSFLFVSTLRENLAQSLASSAAAQVDTIEAQLRNGDTDAQAVVSGQNDVFVQIVRNGRLVAGDHRSVTRPVLTSPGVREEVRIPGLHDSYAVVARRTGSSTLIVVGRSEEQVARATSVSAALLGVSVPLGLAALAVVVWLSVGRALRPVEEMRTQAAAITSDRLHERLVVPAGTDEIPRLARTLNELLDRIDAGQRLQRQFVSDASHELRSPLAALRQLAEVARRHPERVGTAAFAGDVLIEEHRMEELVTAMLTLARPDDEQRVRREVDLDDLVLAELARVRDADGPVIDASGVGAGRVLGNPVLLGQVVRNLVANARRHADGRVVVQLAETQHAQTQHAQTQHAQTQHDETQQDAPGPTVVLVVHDDGGGIAEDQREAVFERFVRLDEARTRDEGGAGLGLAIVRKVVLGLGGTITVDDGPLGGARFTLRLPAAPVDQG